MADNKKTLFEIRMEYLVMLHKLNQENIKKGLPIIPIPDWDWNLPIDNYISCEEIIK